MARVVAILQEMWDWRSMTTSAGYAECAPEYFRINEYNFTGGRLYDWIGHSDMLVTNACPELVSSARGRGKPDRAWLANNLTSLQPFELLLVCGKVAEVTYRDARVIQMYRPGNERIVVVPHPAARTWTRAGLSFAKRIIQEGRSNVHMFFRQGRLVCTTLET